MEQNSEPEWADNIQEVAFPFHIKKEKTSSDDESEANSQPSKQDKSSECMGSFYLNKKCVG